MDKREAGVGEPEAAEDPARLADELERRIEVIRDDLGGLVGELDRRRHRVGKPLAIGAAALAAVAVGGIVLWQLRRRRRRHSLGYKLGQTIGALRRAITHPDRVAPRKQEPSVPRKVLAAAAASVASVLARRWAVRLLRA